jgi:hypothetical protein
MQKANKMNYSKLLLTFVLALLFSNCIAADKTQKHPSPPIYLTGESHLESISKYLGMSLETYGKFHASLRGDARAEKYGPGFSLTNHPASVEFRNYLESGQSIPNSLVEELTSVYLLYRQGLATYAGLPLESFESAERKMAIIESSLISLNQIHLNPSTSSAEEDVEVIVVTNEASLQEKASGGRVGTVVRVHSAGVGRLEGIVVSTSVNVTFRNSSGQNLGVQTWRVTNSWAWPTENIQGGALVPL